ncbi:Uncharacterised protein [uncultured archaeon]|nr:Uncharacterised protein [uncultured archaeon]
MPFLKASGINSVVRGELVGNGTQLLQRSSATVASKHCAKQSSSFKQLWKKPETWVTLAFFALIVPFSASNASTYKENANEPEISYSFHQNKVAQKNNKTIAKTQVSEQFSNGERNGTSVSDVIYEQVSISAMNGSYLTWGTGGRYFCLSSTTYTVNAFMYSDKLEGLGKSCTIEKLGSRKNSEVLEEAIKHFSGEIPDSVPFGFNGCYVRGEDIRRVMFALKTLPDGWVNPIVETYEFYSVKAKSDAGKFTNHILIKFGGYVSGFVGIAENSDGQNLSLNELKSRVDRLYAGVSSELTEFGKKQDEKGDDWKSILAAIIDMVKKEKNAIEKGDDWKSILASIIVINVVGYALIRVWSKFIKLAGGVGMKTKGSDETDPPDVR